MKKVLFAFGLYFATLLPVSAACTVPNTLVNDTIADATPVMANFNAIATCASITALGAAAAVADADMFATNQGATSNLVQTFTAVKTWIKAWITKTDVGLSNVANVDTTVASNISSGTLPAARLPLTSATLQGDPAGPAATGAAAAVTMGTGTTCKITPVYSGRVRFTYTGTVLNTNATSYTVFQMKYGTGVAPGNNVAAAGVGTALGSAQIGTSTAASAYVPVAVTGIATGLTPGVAYWFDATLYQTGGGNSSLLNPSCTAQEF